jgi:hypothetical protein
MRTKAFVLLMSGFLGCASAQTDGGNSGPPKDPALPKPNQAKALPNVRDLDVRGLDVRNYDFAAQVPGLPLTGGESAAITMSPCPPGVAGIDQNHYLYIAGGIGAAEPVLIAGGTCADGESSGTLTFTPAHDHAGSWMIGSASSGIKEALNECAANHAGSVLIPGGAWNIFAVLDISNPCALSGSGQTVTTLRCRMLSRCLQWIGSSGNAYNVSLKNLQISYPSAGTSQEALYIEDAATGDVDDVIIAEPFDGITLYSVAHLFLHHVYEWVNRNGINISSNPRSSVTAASYPQVHDVNIILQHSGTGLNLKASLAGPQFANMVIWGGDDCIAAEESSGNPVNEVNFQGTCDAYAQNGVDLHLSNGSAALRWILHDSLFEGKTSSFFGILLTASNADTGTYYDFTIANNTIGYGQFAAIAIEGARGAVISGNTLYANTSSKGVGAAIEIISESTNSGVSITGNNIGGGGTATGTSHAGILVDSNDHSNIHISSNLFYPTSGEAVVDRHTGSGRVEWRDNTGVDDVIPSVASASTIIRPVNPAWKITGTETVTRIQGNLWPGLRITILNETDSTITIGGGGNIPLPHALSPRTALSLVYDGSNWY